MAPIGVSEILKITGVATELKRQGKDIIVLGAGEPDFDTLEHVRTRRNVQWMPARQNITPELKTAIRAKFKRDNGLDFAQDEITVSTGAKQVLFNAMMATLEVGDEVIIPTPYWVTHADIVRIMGGRPALVTCYEANGFRLSPEDLARAITTRTR